MLSTVSIPFKKWFLEVFASRAKESREVSSKEQEILDPKEDKVSHLYYDTLVMIFVYIYI